MRPDIGTTVDDNLPDTFTECVEAVRITGSNIAAVQPSIPQCLTGIFRVFPVTFHHTVTLYQYLTLLACCDIGAIGIILTIAGVILITYTRDTSIAEFFGKGSGWILVSSVFSSISIVTAKSRIKDIHPGILTLNRVIFLFVFALAAMLIRQESFVISGRATMNLAIGSLLGPFLTGMAQYSALKYIEASRTMIIQATRSLFVLVGSMIYLSILPEMLQLIGGLVTIVGVIVMTWGKMKFKKKAGP